MKTKLIDAVFRLEELAKQRDAILDQERMLEQQIENVLKKSVQDYSNGKPVRVNEFLLKGNGFSGITVQRLHSVSGDIEIDVEQEKDG